MQFPYAEIEQKIGYVFRDKSLLKEAFTHTSYSNTYGGKHNERMEYLGDSVLQLVVTDWQYHGDTRAREGELTKERQRLVCEDALDKAVHNLDIEKYLLVAGGKANIGKKTISSLFETVIAAIYLDGGYENAKDFILRHAVLKGVDKTDNPKGALQEYLQSMGEQPPTYECEKIGMDNAPTFICTAKAFKRQARGEGGSKKQAEQNAAAALLDELMREAKAQQKRKK